MPRIIYLKSNVIDHKYVYTMSWQCNTEIIQSILTVDCFRKLTSRKRRGDAL